MFELDIEEMRCMISGKFTFRKCIECDGKGWLWYDDASGEQVNKPELQEGETNVEFYYSRESCYDCCGLGGFLTIGENYF